MIKVGLTGSIGMGKSTVCNFFKELGVKVWSADDAVHEMYQNGGMAIKPISKSFPSAINENGDIDRQKLSKLIIENPNLVSDLEKIVHPLVKRHREIFFKKHFEQKYIIFDIPLLFETNTQTEFDKIIVVDCNPEIQKQRVLARDGMSVEKFQTILSRQLPNSLKVKQADIIIDTNRPLSEVKQKVKEINSEILKEANARNSL